MASEGFTTGYTLVAVCLLDEAGCLPEEHFLSLFQAVLGFLCAANESLNVGEGACQGVDEEGHVKALQLKLNEYRKEYDDLKRAIGVNCDDKK